MNSPQPWPEELQALNQAFSQRESELQAQARDAQAGNAAAAEEIAALCLAQQALQTQLEGLEQARQSAAVALSQAEAEHANQGLRLKAEMEAELRRVRESLAERAAAEAALLRQQVDALERQLASQQATLSAAELQVQLADRNAAECAAALQAAEAEHARHLAASADLLASEVAALQSKADTESRQQTQAFQERLAAAESQAAQSAAALQAAEAEHARHLAAAADSSVREVAALRSQADTESSQQTQAFQERLAAAESQAAQSAAALQAAEAEHARHLAAAADSSVREVAALRSQADTESSQQTQAFQERLAAAESAAAAQRAELALAQRAAEEASKARALALRERQEAVAAAQTTKESMLQAAAQRAMQEREASDRHAASLRAGHDEMRTLQATWAAREAELADRLAGFQRQAQEAAERDRASRDTLLDRMHANEQAQAQREQAWQRKTGELHHALQQLQAKAADQALGHQQALHRLQTDQTRQKAESDAAHQQVSALAEQRARDLQGLQQEHGALLKEEAGLRGALSLAHQRFQSLQQESLERAAALQQAADAARALQQHWQAESEEWARREDAAKAEVQRLRDAAVTDSAQLAHMQDRLASWKRYAVAVQTRQGTRQLPWWQRRRRGPDGREGAPWPEPPSYAVEPTTADGSADGGPIDPARPERSAQSGRRDIHALPSLPQRIPDQMPMQHIAQLLSQHGSDFVVCAYRAVLGREPDPEGYDYFLSRLLAEHDKVSILRELAISDEGRQFGARLTGLAELVASHQPGARLLRRWINKLWRTELSSTRTEWSLAALGQSADQKLRDADMRAEQVLLRLDEMSRQWQAEARERSEQLLEQLHLQADAVVEAVAAAARAQEPLRAAVERQQAELSQGLDAVRVQLAELNTRFAEPTPHPHAQQAHAAHSLRLEGAHGANALFDSLQQQLGLSSEALALALKRGP